MRHRFAIYHTHSQNPGYQMRSLSECLYEELTKRGINPDEDIERLGPLFEIPAELMPKETAKFVAGFLVDNICTSIEISNVVIALDGEDDPVVMWQMGHAHALGKPVIAVGTDDVPENALIKGSVIACIDHILLPERLSILAAMVAMEKDQSDAIAEDDVVVLTSTRE